METILVFDPLREGRHDGHPARRRKGSSSPAQREKRGGEGRYPSTDFYLLEGGIGSGGSRSASSVPARKPGRVSRAPVPGLGLSGATVPVSRATVPAHRSTVPGRRATVPGRRATVPGLLATVPAFRATVPVLDLPRKALVAAKAGLASLLRAKPTVPGAVPGAGEGEVSETATPGHAGFRLPRRAAIVASAVAVFLAAGALLLLSSAEPLFPLPEGGIAASGPAIDDELLDFMTPELSPGLLVESLPPIPISLKTETYIVRKGDTLGSIAAREGVDVDSLVSLNGISRAKGLIAGKALKIPNMRGVVHVVQKGESLSSIARAAKIDMTAIADANELGSATLTPGQVVFIPGGKLSTEELKRVYGEDITWPLSGRLSSYFGYRPDPFTGVRRFHTGIDIAVASGTPVHSVMDGIVADSGYNQQFGNYVIVNHPGGLQSLYGHLSRRDAKAGQRVRQGDVLGLSGNTGYSTAPHLHLSMYKGGNMVNPLKYLD